MRAVTSRVAALCRSLRSAQKKAPFYSLRIKARTTFAASKLPVKLLIQPGDGVQRLVKGIKKAKERVEITIFRFDRAEIERALIDAAERGVFVHTLIAFTNRGGEESLRKLEKRFLANGITVSRPQSLCEAFQQTRESAPIPARVTIGRIGIGHGGQAARPRRR